MARDALISSFFTQVPRGTGENDAVGDRRPTPPTPGPAGTTRQREGTDSDVEDDRAATKQPRTDGGRSSGSNSSRTPNIARLQQWRYDRGSALNLGGAQSSGEVHQGGVAGNAALGLTPRTAEQEARHAAFSARLLGSVEARMKRDEERRAKATEEMELVEEQEESPEVERDNSLLEFAAEPAAGRSKAAKEKPALAPDGTKYTPLEMQYLELRKAHPDVLLCIEVGYKFKFYGDDARIASRELNIACFMEKHLMTAMVPLHRLQLHIKKLVLAGHKVGVVRQTETRALKAISANASKPFARELTELYTASTWVDDMLEPGGSDGLNPASPRSLVALVEKSEGGVTGGEERVSIGMIAVQTSTGTITYDQFTDTTMRSELETRLAHLEPAEMIIPDQISRQTSRLLRYIAGQSSMSTTAVRVETVETVPSYNAAYSAVGEFYSKDASEFAKQGYGKTSGNPILSVVYALPSLALIALAVAIEHMSSFRLESVFRLATNFTSFSHRHEMLLTGNTLNNLEILQNNTDYREKGSLMWMLSGGASTAMGKRMIRRWLTRPLTNVDTLRERSDAVESLLGERYVASKASDLLKGLPDLEKGLARLLYHRAAPTELATILLSLNRVTTEFEPHQFASSLGSSLLEEVIGVLPKARQVVQEALAAIDVPQARENNKRDLFTDVDRFGYIQDTKDIISVVECDLQEHLRDLRKLVKNPRLQYASIAGEEYLIEVARDTRLSLPADWSRINSTKKMIRYRSPQVILLMKQRAQLEETLDAQAEQAYRSFTRQVCDDHYSLLREVVLSLATLDALLSFSVLASLPGYSKVSFVEPKEEGGGSCIDIRNFRHPMSEALMEDQYVDNDLILGDEAPDKARGVLLTGSNMGGKSSTVRAIALVVIMAQVGSYVPATYARLSLHDAVLTRMGASDQLAKGRSTFMVEVQETAEIIRTATSKTLVLLDELGRGTSTHDGQAIAEAVLQHLLEREESRRPVLFFVTHFLSLGRMTATLPLRGMHMAYLDNGDGDISFLYKIRDGLAEKSFGIHCARLAALPSRLLDLATVKAKELEDKTSERAKRRRQARAMQLVQLLFTSHNGNRSKLDDLHLIHLAANVLGVTL